MVPQYAHTHAIANWTHSAWRLRERSGLPSLHLGRNETFLDGSIVHEDAGCTLKSLLSKLARGAPVHLLFLGTSMTEGAVRLEEDGSFAYSKSHAWPARLVEAMRLAWPRSNVTFINAAAGGTSPGYAAVCIDALLAGRRTDLVLVEYTQPSTRSEQLSLLLDMIRQRALPVLGVDYFHPLDVYKYVARRCDSSPPAFTCDQLDVYRNPEVKVASSCGMCSICVQLMLHGNHESIICVLTLIYMYMYASSRMPYDAPSPPRSCEPMPISTSVSTPTWMSMSMSYEGPCLVHVHIHVHALSMSSTMYPPCILHVCG